MWHNYLLYSGYVAILRDAEHEFSSLIIMLQHPAGTSKDSDKCDLSKDSEIAPLTLGSMDNSFFYHLFCFTQESYLSKDLGEIYIWKNL